MIAPGISVIVPHYNDLVSLDRCLNLLTQQAKGSRDFEVVVADNASPQGYDAVKDVINGRAILVQVDERGAGPARNGAVAKSTGKILAFIDSDCQPEADWLMQGCSALRNYDFVGGRVKVLVNDFDNPTPVEAFEQVFAFDFKSYITKKGFTGAGNLFCSRKVFDSVGPFKPGISEDVEWSRRAVRLGFTLGYAPLAIVGHPARRTWKDLKAKWARMNREAFNLDVSNNLDRLIWIAKSLLLPPSAILHTLKIFLSGDLRSIRHRIAATKVLFEIRMWRSFDRFRLLLSNTRWRNAY